MLIEPGYAAIACYSLMYLAIPALFVFVFTCFYFSCKNKETWLKHSNLWYLMSVVFSAIAIMFAKYWGAYQKYVFHHEALLNNPLGLSIAEYSIYGLDSLMTSVLGIIIVATLIFILVYEGFKKKEPITAGILFGTILGALLTLLCPHVQVCFSLLANQIIGV